MSAMSEKIKALLAKARSTDNEHEAETFFNKAFELMEKYQLDVTDLEKDDPVDCEILFKSKTGSAGDWDFRLMFAVAKYYGCEGVRTVYGYHTGFHMNLIGRESARLTAKEMHAYLVETVRRRGRELAKQTGEKPTTCARRIGVELHARIHRLVPKPDKPSTAAGKNALVTLDAVKQFKDKMFPDLRSIKGSKLLGSGEARKIAEGISLNLQAGQSKTLRLG